MRRIYSELLPYETVAAPETTRLLARYGLSLVLAVRPWDLEALPGVARVMRDAGVPLAVWPMVEDAEGRWASAGNVEPFTRLVERTLDALEGSLAPTEVLLNLEPPFEDAVALSHGTRGILRIGRAATSAVFDHAGFAHARSALGGVAQAVHARGVATSSAVWPLVALDPGGRAPFQRLLGTPVDGLGVSRVSVMLYSSIFEGWSRGVLGRRGAEAVLSRFARRVHARWGASGGVSLGCVGHGALGDEPVYRGPAELAADVALARAAGCDDLSLFDLAGVLSRPPAAAWLDAFAHAAP